MDVVNNMLAYTQEDISNLINRVRSGDINAYNKLVEYYYYNKDKMIPSVAKDLRRSISYAKKYLNLI